MIEAVSKFVVAKDLSFSGILHDIKKSPTSLSPIFEAFTNALESLKTKKKDDERFGNGKIFISIYANELTDSTSEFRALEIFDNGVGFNELEFKRFNTFKDNSKGYKNLGSGRIQFVHFFDRTTVKSVFKKDDQYFEREFVVSKSKSFLNNNAIVKQNFCVTTDKQDTYTKVIFTSLLEQSQKYNSLNDDSLKEELIRRYLHYFCFNSNEIPEIIIDFYIDNVLKTTSKIDKFDIPKYDKKENFEVNYSKTSDDAKTIEKSTKTESFLITTFKVQRKLLDVNDLKLISKGEVVEDTKINLTGISKNDNIEGNKYLVLISGNFIDEKDTNIRGELDIPSKNSSKVFNAFNSEIIFLEDIEINANEKLKNLYPEIEQIIAKHENELEYLKEMFLIEEDENVDISFNDDDKRILEKFYEAQAKKEARIDASIKESIDRLEDLDTTSENYQDELEKEIDKLVRILPEQNKRTLSHYVARRKLVLELFSKIQDKKLKIQNDESRVKDEALIHNLLFTQKSTNTYGSDLWILNEEFIYFKGNSEFLLRDLELDGKKVFQSEFTKEEEKYLNSLGKKRLDKRPDVLLFPEEGKCIIIEFKAPKVNASEHLTQINMYASLIRNYTHKEFEIKTFYGYLIGEGIESKDVQGSVSTFEYSQNFDYLFSPSQKVIGFDGNENGSIYTEVLKYSSLLERATLRNKIFIEKLGLKI
ncbi:MAG: ATP-binding protein [Flavobacterium sp.]|nr:ATP-binding protein [Flavobacterium sp.]